MSGSQTAANTAPTNILTTTSGGSVADASGNVWTLTANGALDENGTEVPGGEGTSGLTAVSGLIWAQDAGSGTWYTYANGTFTSQGSATPPTPASTAPTIILTTSGGSVADASGNVWTLTANGALNENGTEVPGGEGTSGLTAVSGLIWAQDAGSGTWYTYANGTFTSQGSATPPAPPIISNVITISSVGVTLSFGNGGSYIITGSNDLITFGSGVSVTMQGANDSINVGANSTVDAIGNGDTITGAANVTVNLSGTNFTVYATGDTIATTANTSISNLIGNNNTVILGGTGDSLAAYGGANTISSGANDLVVIGNTNGAIDTVNASGDQSGGTTANDQVTGIYLNSNAQANVVGSGNGIGLATGDSLGAYGGANTISSGANDLVVIGNTNGAIDTVNASGDQSGGTTANGQGTGIYLNSNAQANVVGSGNGIGLATGDSLGAYGGANTISSGANDLVVIGNTNGAIDTVNASGDQSGGTTANGQGTGIYLNSNAQANVAGSNDSIGLGGTGDYLGLLGGSGYSVTAIGDTINTWSNTSFNLAGGNDSVGLGGTGDYLGLLGGSGYSVTAIGDTIDTWSNTSFNLAGGNDSIGLGGTGDYLGLLGGGGYSVSATGDTIDTLGNTSLNLAGGNDSVGLGGAGDYLGLLGGSGYVVGAVGDTINTTANTSLNLSGGSDSVGLGGSGDYLGLLGGTGYSVTAVGDTINTTANTSLNLAGGNDSVGLGGEGDYLGLLGGSGYLVGATGATIETWGNTSLNLGGGNDSVGLGGTGDYLGLLGGSGYSVTAIGDTIDTTANTSFNLAGGNDGVGLLGAGDSVGLLSGSGYVVSEGDASDQVNLAGPVTTTVYGAGGSIGASGIDAIYNAVLDRDMTSAELTSAEAQLATGTSLNTLQVELANSAEAQSDMDSTYAAVASGSNLALLDVQPQSNVEVPTGGGAPTQAEFNAFADAMSSTYGAPMELVSVDPLTGVQTELADTNVTNLLAELPVLETEADGVNLGLQLADGTQVQFASTARLATFLYSVAVQQMQATSFVTDNYNLDMQWLSTVDQPLLQEAVFWSERATAEAPTQSERAIEDNIQASLALQIAAEAPASRQDMSVTINNAATGNPTQITVHAAADGSTIHDVAPGIFGYVEEAISTVLTVAAAVTGQAYLYYAAAVVDAAEAGQDVSQGQILPAILSLAQAVAAGISGAAGGTSPTTPAPQTAQILNAAAQGVGGVYGIVQSAETGNAAGILAGALEAAAAGATGIGMAYGDQTQALNAVAAALGTAGLATSMASDFASGKLAQGLVDSLNLYLPAVAQAYVNSSNNGSASLGWAAQSTTATAVGPGGLTNFDSTVGSNAMGGVVTQDGQTYVVAADQSEAGSDNATISLSSIVDTIVGGVLDDIRFLGSAAAQALDMAVPTATSARNMSTTPVPFMDNNGSPILNQQNQTMMMPANADPAAVTDIGSSLTQLGGLDPSAPDGGTTLAEEQLALFRQGGAWDFQRVGPSSTFVGAFRDYANVEVGAYAASIGMSLDDVLFISNQYAKVFSRFSSTGSVPDPNPIYTTLPNVNVWDITEGYSLYQGGKIGHH